MFLLLLWLDSPTGSVPYIIVDGQTKVAQSMAIARFVAKRFGLSGKNDLDDLKIDSLVDCLHDLTEIFRGNPREIYLISIFTPEQRERAVARLAELGDKHLSTLEKLIGMYSRAKGYTVGDYLTWADIYLYDTMFYILKVNPKALDAYPHVSAVKKNVEAHPKIGAYLKSRPPTAKP